MSPLITKQNGNEFVPTQNRFNAYFSGSYSFSFFRQSVFKLINETLHLFQHFRTWQDILSKTSVDPKMLMKYLQYHIEKYQLHALNIFVLKFHENYSLQMNSIIYHLFLGKKLI